MRNRMYGGVRGRKTRVGEKLHRFPPTRFHPSPVHHTPIHLYTINHKLSTKICIYAFFFVSVQANLYKFVNCKFVNRKLYGFYRHYY